MSKAIQRYQQDLCKQAAGLFPTWLPGDRMDPGDVGTLVDGRFHRNTNLSELGITLELDEPGSANSLRYSSTKETKISFGGGGAISEALANIASASARVDINFGTEGAFVFHADGVRQLRIKNHGDVEGRIVTLRQSNRWRSDWYLVEEVYQADCATIIVSQGESTSLSLAVQGDMQLGSFSLSDPKLSMSVVASHGLVFHVIGTRSLRPLYTCSRLSGGWIRSRYLKTVRGEPGGDKDRLERAPLGDLLKSWQETQ